MITRNDQRTGKQTIVEDLKFHGQIIGQTTVNPRVTLILHGQIVGNLVVSESSNVVIHGMVIGNVTNNGGNLEVFGIITGDISNNGGTTVIQPKAIVNGQRL